MELSINYFVNLKVVCELISLEVKGILQVIGFCQFFFLSCKRSSYPFLFTHFVLTSPTFTIVIASKSFLQTKFSKSNQRRTKSVMQCSRPISAKKRAGASNRTSRLYKSRFLQVWERVLPTVRKSDQMTFQNVLSCPWQASQGKSVSSFSRNKPCS